MPPLPFFPPAFIPSAVVVVDVDADDVVGSSDNIIAVVVAAEGSDDGLVLVVAGVVVSGSAGSGGVSGLGWILGLVVTASASSWLFTWLSSD